MLLLDLAGRGGKPSVSRQAASAGIGTLSTSSTPNGVESTSVEVSILAGRPTPRSVRAMVSLGNGESP